jgi:hypothetical protein
MATTQAEVLAAVATPRRTVPAVVFGVGPVLLAHYVVPHWSTLYGSYLVAFSVWMVWFVLVVVDVLGNPLESAETGAREGR